MGCLGVLLRDGACERQDSLQPLLLLVRFEILDVLPDGPVDNPRKVLVLVLRCEMQQLLTQVVIKIQRRLHADIVHCDRRIL